MKSRTAARLLPRLKKICLALPEAGVKLTWGNPTFFARRQAFAVLDHYEGHDCLVLKPRSAALKKKLLADPRYFDPPYVGKKGWIALKLDAGSTDWGLVEALVHESYQKMLFP